MKFKLIFIFFNAIIIFSFIFIFLVPILILGTEYSQVLWSKEWIWILSFFFAAVVIGMNIFFILNWKFFTYLEREDWDSLLVYLEKQIYDKKRYRKQFVRILINAYLVKGNTEKVTDLKKTLEEEKKNLHLDFALYFGIPKILSNDENVMENYFRDLLSKKELSRLRYRKTRHWTFLLLGFSLVVGNKYEEAKDYIEELLEQKPKKLLIGFTIYLLSTFPDQDTREDAERKREDFCKEVPYKKWLRYIEQEKSNVLLIVLSRFVNEATGRLYPDKSIPTQNSELQ